MCGQEHRVPGAMSPYWDGSLDLARLTCLIWLFGLHSTGRTLHIRPNLRVRHKASQAYRSTARRDEPGRLRIHHKLDKISFDPQMSYSRKGKSIWKRSSRSQRVRQRWRMMRSCFSASTRRLVDARRPITWSGKILKYSTRFSNELRTGVRENPTVDEILDANKMLQYHSMEQEGERRPLS